MNDLTTGYLETPEVAAGDAAGRFDPETDAAEMDRWVAFMRGEDPSPRRDPGHPKKSWGFIGFRKRGHSGQFSNP